MSVAARIQVHCLVQGVGYRFFVYRLATRLGLTGYVRNAYDGTVEIGVEGQRSSIEDLIKEVKVGPRASHVTDVSVEWEEFSGRFHDFEVQ